MCIAYDSVWYCSSKREIDMDQASPKIIVGYEENVTIVTLTDARILEEADINAIEGSIMPLVGQIKDINLVIDFCNVQFLSSAVLGLLIRVSKRVYESGGQLRLCGINRKILEIFKITRLDKVFEIFEDREKAVASLS